MDAVRTCGSVEQHSAAQLLRKRTADAHARVGLATGLMSADVSLKRYVSLLGGFAQLHQALERQIGDVLADDLANNSDNKTMLGELDFDNRRKTPALRADLAELRQSLPSPAAPFREISNVAAALGAMYVCEGATQGGRIIAAHVRAVLGERTPVAFFSSYGPDVDRRWSEFRRVLSAVLRTDTERETAAACAITVFDRFGETLTA